MSDAENSGQQRGRPFLPGQSGNPGGRPRVVAAIRDLARSHAADAIAALVDVALHGKNESARVAAASAILDRGFGRPGPPATDPPVIGGFPNLSDLLGG